MQNTDLESDIIAESYTLKSTVYIVWEKKST